METLVRGTDRRTMHTPHAPRASTSVDREWDRSVPLAWEQLLYTYLPREGPVTLMLAWEPGDPWMPKERWMLYETFARWWVGEFDPDRLAELEGPDPRCDVDHYCALGYCQCALKKNKFVYRAGGHTPTKIDYWQWRFYQRTGRSPIRYWTIQGDQGGHRFALSQYERRIWQMKTGAADTPVIGALPYADFDARVLKDVVAYEPIRRMNMHLLLRSKDEARRQMQAQDDALRVEQRTMVADDLAERTKDSADVLKFAMRQASPYDRAEVTTKEDRIAHGKRYDADVMRHNLIHDE